MDKLKQAQEIAKESGFDLREKNGRYFAVHTVEGDGVVLDMWQSYFGNDPLKVAEAAKDAKYNPLELNPITRHGRSWPRSVD